MRALLLGVTGLVGVAIAQPAVAQGGPGGGGPGGPGGGPGGGQAAATLEARIAQADQINYRESSRVHAGAGTMTLGTLLGGNAVPHLGFVHRGVIPPGAGIGHHVHYTSEEMFFILNDAEPEFTINGRTAKVQTPGGVPVFLDGAHAIYNSGDTPLEWLNVAVRAEGRQGGAFDLGDARVGADLDPIPVFVTARFDRNMLRSQEGMHGGQGTAMYRRVLQPGLFRTTWAYVDHLVLQPGASTGMHRHPEVSEIYYVKEGQGEIRVGSETASVRVGSTVPLRPNESKALRNTGSEPLEIIIIGIATDMNKNLQAVVDPT